MFKGKINIISKGSAEDTFALKQIQKLLFNMRKPGLPTKDSQVILLLSGGLDSISLWFYLMSYFDYQVFPIYLKRSLQDAQYRSVCYYSSLFQKRFPKKYKKVRVLDAPKMFSINNVWTRQILNHPEFVLTNSVSKKNTDQYQLWFTSTPTRLGHYLSSAVDYFLELKFNKNISLSSIFLGLVPEDRLARESTQTVLSAFNLAFCTVLGDFDIRFFAPFDKKANFYIPQKNLIRYALDRGVDLSKTWSCFHYQRKNPCNKCVGCHTRNQLLSKKTGEGWIKKAIKKLLKNDKSFSEEIEKKRINLFLTDKIAIINGLYEHKSGNKTFLMKKNTEIIELNALGQFIWQMIKKNSESVGQIIKFVGEQYPNSSKKMIKKDVIEFLEICCTNGICKKIT